LEFKKKKKKKKQSMILSTRQWDIAANTAFRVKHVAVRKAVWQSAFSPTAMPFSKVLLLQPNWLFSSSA